MINSREIEKIQADFTEGKINLQECINKLMTSILKERYFFGLAKLNEESLYDYSFYVYRKIENCLKTYDPKKSSFCSYLQNLTRMEFSEWKKNQMKNTLKNQAILNWNSIQYSQHESENAQISDIENFEDKDENKEHSSLCKKIKTNELYVIILKSVFYLTQEQISKVTEKFDMDFEELTIYLKEAENCVKDKIIRLKNLKELTNNDFIKQEELRLGIEKFEKNTTTYYRYCLEYQNVCDRYKRRKERLYSMKIIPSDKAVGKILKIPPSNVRYILKKYYKIFNIK